MAILSREGRICLAIWRKAYREREREPLIVTCSNYSNAISTRQALYRAIRPYRNGEEFDEELYQASQRIVPTVEQLEDKNSKHRIVMKPRVVIDELNAALDDLGISENDLLTNEEKELTNKFDRPNLPDDYLKNPFYERES